MIRRIVLAMVLAVAILTSGNVITTTTGTSPVVSAATISKPIAAQPVESSDPYWMQQYVVSCWKVNFYRIVCSGSWQWVWVNG